MPQREDFRAWGPAAKAVPGGVLPSMLPITPCLPGPDSTPSVPLQDPTRDAAVKRQLDAHCRGGTHQLHAVLSLAGRGGHGRHGAGGRLGGCGSGRLTGKMNGFNHTAYRAPSEVSCKL